MPPKKSKSASNKKGKGKGNAADAEPELPDPFAIRRRDLKPQYIAFCKQYVAEPLPAIVKRIDDAIETKKEIQQLIFDSPILRTSDIAAVRSTFRKYTPLAGICVWKSRFRDTSLQTLIDFFLMKQTLSVLQLVGNDLGNANAATVAHLCRESAKLKVLVLDHNHFGKGCEKILDALCHNSSCQLQKLSMRYCAMDAGASHLLGDLILRSTSLRILDLGGNMLQDVGLSEISQAISHNKTLTTLSLAFNEILDSAVSGTLPFAELCRAINVSSLTTVDLSGNFIGDHGMEKLLGIQELRKANWAVGKAPGLKILVPERANNVVFDAIWTLNTLMASTGKSKKKGKKK